MAVELLEQVVAIEGAAKAEAAKTYALLLGRAERPEVDDAARLIEAMELLGRTPADLEGDLKALAEAGRLEALAAKVGEREEAAAKAAAESDVFYRGEIARRLETDARMRELRQAVASTAGRVGQAYEAGGDLARLRVKHWQAFGGTPPTPAPEPLAARSLDYGNTPRPRLRY